MRCCGRSSSSVGRPTRRRRVRPRCWSPAASAPPSPTSPATSPPWSWPSVLPLLTVVVIATQDVTSAVIVLATLPLIPVFGALVGLATRDRAERQWRAMSSLSGYFLDVMRGLPTLVAFRRAEAQTSRIREVTERYRRASLEHPAHRLRELGRARAGRHPLGRPGRGHRRRPPRRRPPGPEHGPGRAAPGAGGLLAAAPGRRRVPRSGRGRRDLRARRRAPVAPGARASH